MAGDIVFSRRGDVERHALITEREAGWLCGTGCLLLRSGESWRSSTFLSMALDAIQARTWLVQHAVGATMPNINTGILGSVPVLLPPDDAVGLDKPNIGLLDEEFLAQVRNLPERNLAVELLERLLEGEIKAQFATNVVQQRRFSDLLSSVMARYQNRSIETAQVMEELVDMAKKFKEAASRGEALGLSEDEVRFYDALANNESAVKELTDVTLKKIAHELTDNLRRNITVDWGQRESVRASLRLMVKRILRKYKYPPDLESSAVELVLQQAEALGASWVA